jgi:hypothetical protein
MDAGKWSGHKKAPLRVLKNTAFETEDGTYFDGFRLAKKYQLQYG